MKHRIRIFAIVWVAVMAIQPLPAEKMISAWGGDGDESAFFDGASAQIKSRVADGKIPAVDAFYKEMFYAPLWVKAGKLSPFGVALLHLIDRDETVTESVALYRERAAIGEQIKALSAKNGGTMKDKVAMELAMSKLYLHYARYRIYGGISWKLFQEKLDKLTEAYKIKVGWERYPPKITPATILDNALNSGDLSQAFDEADPKRFKFGQLKKELIHYIHISRKGGWPKLPGFRVIKPGKSNAKVIPLIRRHLAMVGDLQGCTESMNSPKYDSCLVKAVKRFQLRHGLKGNGVIGKQTRIALNTPVTKLIQKIRLNLDRIKWLYHKQANMRIELNIPAFRLNFFDRDKLVTTIRVVTGKPNHPTPSFHNVMRYIVINPYWKIPESIVRHEMLKHLVRDPYHYEAQGKILKASWDESSERIDPGTVNWSKYVGNNKPIPYYFMQVPSRHNALGKIKFLFPNGYSVYIHDTPSKSLFFRNQRAFSHGCMRIQKPRELLESLALFNDNIDVDAVMKQLEGTEKKTITLKQKVPIDITYLTAFIDPYGYLNFRNDIYRYDKYQMEHYVPQCKPLSTRAIKSSPDKKKVKTVKHTSAQKKTKAVKHASLSKKNEMKLPAAKHPKKLDADGYEVVELYEN